MKSILLSTFFVIAFSASGCSHLYASKSCNKNRKVCCKEKKSCCKGEKKADCGDSCAVKK